jgi:hypothetical protein
VAALCSWLCAFLLAAGLAAGLAAAPVRAAGAPVYYATVRVAASARAAGVIGDQFIGLSFESGTLNSGRFNSNGDLPRLLSNLGNGIMRFGGNTVDTGYAGITPAALAGLMSLADAAGWSVLYSEDLGHYNGAQVAADARAVSAALGSRLLAIGCGNEPDEYSANGLRPPHYLVTTYLAQVGACYHAIRTGAPGIPLEGPDTGFESLRSFFAGYLGRAAHTASWAGLHFYTLGCATPVTDPAAWAGTLLSPGLADAEAAKLDIASARSAAAHIPLLLTEANSACHGGIPGLSDSFAAALWVIDFLLTGAEHGVHGMEFHGGLDTSCRGYTVLCRVAADTYSAQPIYYGLLFTRLLGNGTLRAVTVSTSGRSANLAAFAIQPSGGGLRLMLENLSSARAVVTVSAAGHLGAATVVRLAARSLLATSGVTIQGQSVGADGTFTLAKPDVVHCSFTGCKVYLPGYSAALLTVG